MAGKRGRKPFCPVSYHFTDYLRKCGGCPGGKLCTPDKYKDPDVYGACPHNFKKDYLHE